MLELFDKYCIHSCVKYHAPTFEDAIAMNTARVLPEGLNHVEQDFWCWNSRKTE